MRRAAALALGAIGLALAGCEAVRRTAWQLNVPGSSASFHVDSVRQRVGFLDTRLSAGGIQRRIFAPVDNEHCRSMLVEGATIEWARKEPFGPLSDGVNRCSVVGLGDLEVWRNARGRASTSRRPITSSRTRYTIVHRDEEYLYARGGFSLVGRLGWTPGTDQVIALLPHDQTCAAADRDGRATVEFRIAGTPAFAIVTPQGLCPIAAVIAAPRLEPEPVGPE